MTQTVPHTPSAGEQPEYREEFHVMGEHYFPAPLRPIYPGGKCYSGREKRP